MGLWCDQHWDEAFPGIFSSRGQTRSCDAFADSGEVPPTWKRGVHRRLGSVQQSRTPPSQSCRPSSRCGPPWRDPATGVHTQEAESAWATLKLPIKGRRGIERRDLQSYLNDRMWRQWRGLDNIIANFLPVIASQYRDYSVWLEQSINT